MSESDYIGDIRVVGYSQLPYEIAPGLMINAEPQVLETDNWTKGIRELRPNGRVRIVIEGDREKVGRVLGKNFHKRLRRERGLS